jgi:hypothetical protein
MVLGWAAAAAAALAIAGLSWLVSMDTLDRALERLPAGGPTAAIEASAARLTRAFEQTTIVTNVDSGAESALSPLPERP